MDALGDIGPLCTDAHKAPQQPFYASFMVVAHLILVFFSLTFTEK